MENNLERNLLDEEILEKSLNEDPEYFGVIVSRFEEAFLRKALSILKNKEDAEDAVQDSFTKIYIHGGKFSKIPGANFSSWAYRILINTCLSKYNKKKRRKTTNISEELESILKSEEMPIPIKLGLKEEVLFGLSKIPEKFQKVLRLQFIEGYSQKEIAQMEGTSQSAIKSRTYRAKKKFKEAYGK